MGSWWIGRWFVVFDKSYISVADDWDGRTGEERRQKRETSLQMIADDMTVLALRARDQHGAVVEAVL